MVKKLHILWAYIFLKSYVIIMQQDCLPTDIVIIHSKIVRCLLDSDVNLLPPFTILHYLHQTELKLDILPVWMVKLIHQRAIPT